MAEAADGRSANPTDYKIMTSSIHAAIPMLAGATATCRFYSQSFGGLFTVCGVCVCVCLPKQPEAALATSRPAKDRPNTYGEVQQARAAKSAKWLLCVFGVEDPRGDEWGDLEEYESGVVSRRRNPTAQTLNKDSSAQEVSQHASSIISQPKSVLFLLFWGF